MRGAAIVLLHGRTTLLRKRLLSSSRRERDAEILAEAVAALDGNPLRLTTRAAASNQEQQALTRRELQRLAALGAPELRKAAEAAAAAAANDGDEGSRGGLQGGRGGEQRVSAAELRQLAEGFKTGSALGGALPQDDARAAQVWAIAEEVFDDTSASFSLAVARYTGRAFFDDDGAEDEDEDEDEDAHHARISRAQAAARARIEHLATERAHAPSQYALAKILADGAKRKWTEGGGGGGGGGAEEERRRGSEHPDAVRALQLYTSAAKGAVLPALNNVAVMLAAGDGCAGGQPNDRLARRYLEAGAEMGDPRAMLTLAGWCRSGRGLHVLEDGSAAAGAGDEASAFRWHLEAAKFGLGAAQYATGHHYLTGSGTGATKGAAGEDGDGDSSGDGEPDHAQAAEWFRLAAERGVAEAAVNLAEMCRLGLGTPRGEPRPDEARRWLLKAEALGNHFASDLLAEGGELADSSLDSGGGGSGGVDEHGGGSSSSSSSSGSGSGGSRERELLP